MELRSQPTSETESHTLWLSGGSDRPGKSTLLYRWKYGEVRSTYPRYRYRCEILDLSFRDTHATALSICQAHGSVQVWDVNDDLLWKQPTCVVWIVKHVRCHLSSEFDSLRRLQRRLRYTSEFGRSMAKHTPLALLINHFGSYCRDKVNSIDTDSDDAWIKYYLQLPETKVELAWLMGVRSLCEQCGSESGIIRIIWQMLPGLESSDPLWFPWRIFHASLADSAEQSTLAELLRWCVEQRK